METLKVSNRDSFTEFVYSGPFEFTSVMELVRAISDHCTTEGCSAALVDLTRSARTLGATERHELGKIMGEVWEPNVPVAVLRPAEVADESRFWQLVTQNRGIRARVFTDRAQAENWLEAVAGR